MVNDNACGVMINKKKKKTKLNSRRANVVMLHSFE